jgi:hypothetical protein
MSVSAPAPPVYNVTAGAPITADTQTRLALGGSVTEWRVSASAADIVDDKTYLQDSALMAVLSILQRQLGGNAVIADTFVLSELMRSFAANLPDDQGEGWPASPASFVLDSTGLDAFRAVALKATSVQPLHAANILERDHVILPLHIPGTAITSPAKLKERYRTYKNAVGGAQHWAFFVLTILRGENSKVTVRFCDTSPTFTGRLADVGRAVVREWLHAVGGCFAPVRWQGTSVGFEDFPVPAQPGDTECGLMVILHVALFLMGATVEQHKTFSTKAWVKTLRQNAFYVLVGPQNVMLRLGAANTLPTKRVRVTQVPYTG